MTDLPDWMATMHSRAVQPRSPVQTAIQAPAIPYRNAPRNRPPPRQMRPAEQRAMDPNAGVRRQALGQLQRREGADLATMPRIPRGNQFAEAGSMALEATGLPQVRRGAETLGDVAQAPYQPNAPMRALSGFGELGLGVLGAAMFGEVGAMRPRAPPRLPAIAPDPSPPLTRPPTQIAPNGMPIRPPQPFRNSLRGGNDDLAEAANWATPQAANVNRRRTAFDDELGLPDGEGEAAATGWMTGVTQGNEDALYVWAHDVSGTRGRNPMDGPFRSIEDAQRAASQLRSQGRFPHISVGRDAPTAEAASMRAPSNAGGEALNWLGNDRLIRNPTEADLTRLAELGDEMKYVMDTDGNVYAFSAADAHHNNAMRALRDNGVTVRPLGPGAEVTDPDAAGFIWRNKDGSFAHENANMVESGPYMNWAQRIRGRE